MRVNSIYLYVNEHYYESALHCLITVVLHIAFSFSIENKEKPRKSHECGSAGPTVELGRIDHSCVEIAMPL